MLDYEPILVETKNWKKLSYEWFKKNNDVYLVFVDKITNEDRELFKIIKSKYEISLDDLKKIKIQKNCFIKETVSNEEIRIETDCIGKPLIIKVSYYPNWKIEGAKKIYLISPSLMLIFPERDHIRLFYNETILDQLSFILTIIGIITFIYLIIFKTFGLNQNIKRFFNR